MKLRIQRGACVLAAAPLLFVAAATASVHAAPAASEPAATAPGPGYGPGGGYGPGMMRGYGPGYGGGAYHRGGYGPGWGPDGGCGGAYGPGYAHGYGPGMMGGGYGYGPGMMGGGHGYGPGMMGGGYGYGPGMRGGWGMGPGMMGYGFGAWGEGLDLSQAQVRKIGDIQKALFDKQWPLMQAMHETMLQGFGAERGAKLDVDAVMKRAKALSDLRLQMLRNRLESLQQFQAVLTPKQRQELSESGPRGRW